MVFSTKCRISTVLNPLNKNKSVSEGIFIYSWLKLTKSVDVKNKSNTFKRI